MQSSFLFSAGSALQRQSQHLQDYSTQSQHLWAGLFSDLEGQAPRAAHRQLVRSAAPWELTASQIAEVAQILYTYGGLVRTLEQLADAPLSTAAAQGRPALAQALDLVCALEIQAACAPEHVAPPRDFADFSAVGLGAMHAINEAVAPPEIRQLARDHPDVILAEVGPGHLVALVYPGGAQALDGLAQAGTQPASVTTLVGGVGSADPSTWAGSLARARAISGATGGVAVAWLGYSAPASIPLAARDAPAREGARGLARFQEGIGKRWPNAQRIVVGYSYGSVVTGAAELLPGKLADDLVLVGSPGTPLKHASQAEGRVWSATNLDDPIRLSTGPHAGAFGPAPTAPEFGARALPQADQKPGGHSDYWANQAFLDGISAIARGARDF